MTIGSKTVLINGIEIEMDSEAEIKDKRTFVLLRFISETIGARVDWNSETGQIIIIK